MSSPSDKWLEQGRREAALPPSAKVLASALRLLAVGRVFTIATIILAPFAMAVIVPAYWHVPFFGWLLLGYGLLYIGLAVASLRWVNLGQGVMQLALLVAFFGIVGALFFGAMSEGRGLPLRFYTFPLSGIAGLIGGCAMFLAHEKRKEYVTLEMAERRGADHGQAQVTTL